MATIDAIECRDALRALAEVPDGLCGLLLTDPPYSSGGAFRSDRNAGSSAKYQRGGAVLHPDFYGDNRDERSFVLWSAMWMGECYRILYEGASALVFSDWRQLANTCDAIQVAGFTLRGIVPWVKPNPRPQPNSFASACEYAVWASKGAIDRRPVPGAKYLPGTYEVAAPDADARVHAAQKPLALMRALMEIADEGCVVLDPFMGSGTTAVAAVQTGRHFMGFEMSREWCDIASARVGRAMAGEHDAG